MTAPLSAAHPSDPARTDCPLPGDGSTEEEALDDLRRALTDLIEELRFLGN